MMPKLFKHLREEHPSPPVSLAKPPRFWTGAALAVIAVVCLALTSFFGGVGTSNVRDRVIAIAAAVLFVILALLATRSISGELYRVTAARGGVAAGSVVRLVVSVVGYTLTAVVGLGMLGLPFERLLLGGAVTGVILGIAAQQALSNTFAGVVLLVARPFNPGDHIRIRSGALGGEFDGVVLAMGLTYVTVSTSSGVLSIPNSSMLSSAVGPWTPPPPPAPTVADPPPVSAAKRSVTP